MKTHPCKLPYVHDIVKTKETKVTYISSEKVAVDTKARRLRVETVARHVERVGLKRST